jgi:hypothetical protein
VIGQSKMAKILALVERRNSGWRINGHEPRGWTRGRALVDLSAPLYPMEKPSGFYAGVKRTRNV